MITDVLKSVTGIAKVIYKQVETTRINSTQCQRLGGRIKVIVDSLNGLDKLPDNRHFELALTALQSLLMDTSRFIENFSDQGRIIRFLKARSHNESFSDFNGRLQQCIQDLGLGLNVQQVMNREQDQADEAADLEYIKSHEKDILAACQGLKDEFSLFRERQEWMVDRMLSMKNHLVGAGAAAAIPPPTPLEDHGALQPAAAQVTRELDEYNLGVACEQRNDFVGALAHYQKAGSYFKANTRIGLFFLKGKAGLTQDKTKAARYLEQGAAGNHPQALHTFGQMLEYGDGIQKDLHRARRMYQCLLDNPSSTQEQKQFATGRLKRVAEKLEAEKCETIG